MKKINFKRLKFGANNSVILIFAIVCAVLLNAVASLAENRFPALKIDLTADAVTKISDETKALLRRLDESETEAEIIYLTGTNDEDADVSDVLRQYDAYSENISLKSENYVKNPAVVTEYQLSPSNNEGIVVVASEDSSRFRVIYESEMWSSSGSTQSFLLESKLTNAIAFLMSDRAINVVMSTGHDEAEVSVLAAMLEEENMTVTSLDLSTADVPADTDIFMILAPQSDFMQTEVDALDTFLSNGGNVVLAFPFNVSLPHLEEYAATWGLNVSDDVILEQDPASSYQQSGMYFYPSVTDNEITSSIDKNIFASYARSLSSSGAGDIYASPILTTSGEAYSVPIVDNDFDKDSMEEGRFNIAYLLEKPLNGSYDETAKLVVTSTPTVWGAINVLYTNYDYIALQSLSESRFGNRDFVLNTVSYMTGVENESIVVPSKSSSTAIMSLSSGQSAIMRLILCVLLPLAVIAAGFIVWLKRRHR